MSTGTAEDFLNEAHGESYPALKFENIGDTFSGTIMTDPRPIMRPNLNTQEPEKQLPINLENVTFAKADGTSTTLEGPRTLWVRQGLLAAAIADAVKDAGANTVQIGGKLGVRFDSTKDTGKPQPARVYKAKYEAPVSAGVSMDEIF